MSHTPSFVVGIGASAGGLEVLQQFFDELTTPTSFAFVVVQHLSSDHESMMDELLSRHSPLPITVVEESVELQADHIYLISHKRNLVVSGERLKPVDKAGEFDLNLPIDTFFYSLAEHYEERALGIVLSGTGTDGSRGIIAIREAGGITMVQDPTTAQFEGMPRAAQAAGVDLVLPVPDIAREIKQLASGTSSPRDYDASTTDEPSLNAILGLVYDRTGNDFRQHRIPTLMRRIDKRAKIVRVPTLSDYHQYLQGHPDEIVRLADEFSISVSRFFRDRSVWNLFSSTVVPELFKQKEDEDTIRVWVPGCATGEEAYTIAILIHEYRARHQLAVDFKIFASDIDKKALTRAGTGEYPLNIFHDVEHRWLEKYFRKTKEGYRVNKEIRERVVFAVHNLISDPSFIRMDLISCRNTLIYIKSEVQQRILRNFHYALRYHGYLMLGTNGNLGEVSRAFRAVAPQSNIFQNVQREKFDRFSPNLSMPRAHRSDPSPSLPVEKKPVPGNSFASDHYAAILMREHAPTAVFVDANANILYINGDVDALLKFPQRQARLNLIDAVGKDEQLLIKNGIQRARRALKSIFFENISFRKGEQVQAFDLRFKEVRHEYLRKKLVLVEFLVPHTAAESKRVLIRPDNVAEQQMEMLEQELQQKDHELQSLTEQLETSNEELQASNEELQASNEELQSSNEELQSVNEELYTVNGELKQKIDEVVSYSSDIDNLLTSTDIATVFLDQDLNVRTVTASAESIINIGQKDIGRPFRNFTTQLKRNHLKKDIEKVRREGRAVRREVETQARKHYYQQVLPYRKSDGSAEGIVLTFVNITDVKKARAARQVAEKKTKEANRRLEMVIESVKVGIWEWVPGTNRVEWNRHMRALYDYAEDQPYYTLEESLARVHPDEQETVRLAFHRSLTTNEPLDLEYRVVWQDQSVHYIYTQGRVVPARRGQQKKLVGTCVDLTQRKAAEEEALQYGQLLENSHNEIYICDARTLRFINVNQGAQENMGYRLSEMRTLTLLDIAPTISRQQFQDLTHRLDQDQDDSVQFETTHQRQDGTYYPVLTNLQATRYRDRNVYVLIVQDITEQALSTAQLKEYNRQLKIANEYLDNFVFTAAHDLRAPVANLISLVDLLHTRTEPSPVTEKIERSVDRLDSTLSGLIKILNIQQYGEDESTEVSFAQTLQSVTKELDKQIQEAGAEIISTFLVPTLCYIPPYLESIVRNLLSNALKYRSEERPLRVTIRTERQNGYVRLQVADNGIGIDLERFKDRLFKPFERLTRQANGKGIGMHLVKTMVEKNGGYLEVESRLNRGTTFIAYLQSYEQN